MKRALYLVGIASCMAVAQNWKSLAKEGVKAGVRTGRALRRVSRRLAEDLQDVRAEAMEELSRENHKASP